MNNYAKQYHEEAPADGQGDAAPAPAPVAANWRDGLSEEYRDAGALKDFADLNAMAKSHLELARYRGQSIRIPTEDAGTEAWDEFNTKLAAKIPGLTRMPNPEDESATKAFWAKAGVPENLEGYQVPEGVTPDSIGKLNEMAQKAGLTNNQFQAMAKTLAETNASSDELAQSDHKAAMDKLSYEWGMAKDSKMANINLLLKNSNAPDTLKEAVATGNVGPEFLQWADGLVKSIGSEGDSLTQDQTSGTGNITPGEAQEAINEIMKNSESAYWNNRDPMHKAMVEKVINYKRMVIAGQS